jgi:hypothetical protein
MMTIRAFCVGASLLALGVGAGPGCKRGADEETLRRLTEANDKVVACKHEVDGLKKEISLLKRQLAVAMTNPTKLQLTDPEIIALIADIRASRGDSGERPTLDPQEASKVVYQGARAMQTCYERALKKNQALQYQSGVGVTLDITVRAAGTVDAVDITPSVDREMTACIKTAAMRWKFPTFQGENVTVSQKFTLTPKT